MTVFSWDLVTVELTTCDSSFPSSSNNQWPSCPVDGGDPSHQRIEPITWNNFILISSDSSLWGDKWTQTCRAFLMFLLSLMSVYCCRQFDVFMLYRLFMETKPKLFVDSKLKTWNYRKSFFLWLVIFVNSDVTADSKSLADTDETWDSMFPCGTRLLPGHACSWGKQLTVTLTWTDSALLRGCCHGNFLPGCHGDEF